MDYKVIWPPRGIASLRTLIEYVAARNPAAARKLGDAILAKSNRLARFPRLGHPFKRLGRDDVRECPVPPFRVIYRVIDDEHRVFVLTVWHGARDEPKIDPDALT